MSVIPLRRDYDASSLRTLACQSKDAGRAAAFLLLLLFMMGCRA